MKKFYLNIILLFISLSICAQGLKVNVPTNVATGENFRLSFVIGTQDAGDIHIGNIPAALEIITGPYRSSQSSYQVINGHASSSSSTTYTYILCANKNGSYKIPSASVVVNGHRYTSAPVTVKVTGKATASADASHKQHNSYSEPTMASAGTKIKNSDLFIKVTANKKSVYEQEPVVLTYKVYTLVDLNELKGDMPDLTGFHSVEVPLPKQKSFHVEEYNGRQYRCVTWSQYVMFPQMHGTLTIPSIVFKGSVVQQRRDIDPIEAFFNGGSGYVEVKRDIAAPSIKLDVKPLPMRPANFSGGVGTFNISAQINKKDIKSNEPFTLRVVVSGCGNLKLIKKPVIAFPKGFDKYDPKVTDKTKITSAGVEGNMIYDFVAVARNKGTYTIPPIEFTYFDTTTNKYKTIKTQPISLNVEKGTSDDSTVDDYTNSLSQKDIYPIKDKEASNIDMNNPFWGSVGYICIILVLLCLGIAALIIDGKMSSASYAASKKKKSANRMALKHLQQANNSMLQGNNTSFYDEVLKALWGYAEEKFNLTANQLNREHIGNMLQANNIQENLIKQFIEIIDVCEMGHYSPTSTTESMDKIFEKAMNVVTEIEDALKREKKRGNRSSKMSLLLLLAIMLSTPASSITKQNADSEYKKGNYQQAIKDYTELLGNKKSPELYYNLGNSYYKMDNMTYAILNYERALLLTPNDKEININLQIAKSKTIDKITPETEMFLTKWFKTIVNVMNINAWAYLSIFCLVVSVVLFFVYLKMSSVRIRKISFFVSLFLFIVFVFSNICAYHQKEQYMNRNGAIIMASSLQLKKVPNEKGANITILHEGTKVYILDKSMKNWLYVRLEDKREGWVRTEQIEKI